MEACDNKDCLIEQHYFQYIIQGAPVTQKKFQMWVNTAMEDKQHRDHSILDLCTDDTCNLKKHIMCMKKKKLFSKKNGQQHQTI